MSDQNQKTKKGLKWSIIDQIIKQIITLLISAVLSRLLTPSQFGLLGMVTVAIGFLQVIKDIGLGSSIIQKQEITSEEKSTIFWLNVIIGSALAIILFLLSPLVSTFFNEPQLSQLLKVMAIGFIISSVSIVPDALIMKAIDFKSIFFRNLGTTIFGGLIGIWLAIKGYGIWALIFQNLITTITGMVFSFSMVRWRPKLIFKVKLLRSHLRYSIPLFADSSVNYWVRNIDNILVGKYLGAVQLGNYTRAYNLMLLPVRQISLTLSRVMFPSFSIIQNEKDKIWMQYCKMMSSVAMISFPIMAILGVYAREVILIIYGTQWLEVVPIFRILCVLGAAQSIATLAGPVYYSTGKTALLFKIGLISKTLMIAGIVIGLIYKGLIGMVWGYTITSLIAFFLEGYFVSKVLGYTLSMYLRNIIPEIYGAIICIFIMSFGYHFFKISNSYFTLKYVSIHCLFIILSILIYFFILYKFKSKGIIILLSFYYGKYKKISSFND